jgi:hypothetical protein
VTGKHISNCGRNVIFPSKPGFIINADLAKWMTYLKDKMIDEETAANTFESSIVKYGYMGKYCKLMINVFITNGNDTLYHYESPDKK